VRARATITNGMAVGTDYTQLFDITITNYTLIPVPGGFSIEETEIPYKLWKVVYYWATDDARGTNRYTFANPGRQGGDHITGPVGTNQHPVTTISWRDAVVWCNAYSEATGKTPVFNYGDVVLRESEDSSVPVILNLEWIV
jgi:hypothetical protein